MTVITRIGQAEAARAVAKGAALMNREDPGWWRPDVDRAIDLGALSLGSPNRCILGQRCPLAIRPPDDDEDGGPYWAYALALAGALPGETEDDRDYRVQVWALEHGFEADQWTVQYADLAAEWRRVISELRAAA